MGKKSGPKAPDYAAAAREQGAMSLELADKQTMQNRPDSYTPWGSQTWTQDGDKWTQNITLSPAEQASLDSQMAIQQGRSGAAQQLLGQATSAFQNPMNWDNLPARSGQIDSSGVPNSSFDPGRGIENAFGFGPGNDVASIRNRAQEAVWQAQKPALDQAREGVEVQLANQGLARGSEAWNREMTRRDDADARARLLAVDAGRAEAGQMFDQGTTAVDQQNRAAGQEFAQNMGLANFENLADSSEFQQLLQAAGFNNMNRQGAISEETMRRGQPLNELNALLTGQQVNMPSMPGTPNSTAGRGETPDLLGAANMQYQSALDAYNAKMGGINNLMGGLGSAAMMFSDARLKEDIRPTGASIGGVPVVHYRYRGLPGLRIGVIAQDALRIRPQAVFMHASGYLMVDYSELCS